MILKDPEEILYADGADNTGTRLGRHFLAFIRMLHNIIVQTVKINLMVNTSAIIIERFNEIEFVRITHCDLWDEVDRKRVLKGVVMGNL